MARTLHCPACGTGHELTNPGILQITCESCQALLYWDAAGTLQVGAESAVPESDARLYLNASGQVDGQGFRVVGHLRYEHGRGGWDEWVLEKDDGSHSWLSESERTLSRETRLDDPGPLPGQGSLVVGQRLQIQGVDYSVRELGTATCAGFQGQLPAVILPGEHYAYADLASLDGECFATLEYDAGGQPTVFAGQTVEHEALQINDDRFQAGVVSTGRAIRCSGCGANLEATADPHAKSRACEYCGVILDLTPNEAEVIGQNQSANEVFAFAVGEAATFAGTRYEVAGRALYQDDEGYRSREYLLFNPDRGYQWLGEEDGHYLLHKPTKIAPAVSVKSLPPGAQVTVGSSRFSLAESGSDTLLHVDGALPYKAFIGEESGYAFLCNPPETFSVEYDGDEVEYFYGKYLPVEEVWEAFGRSETPPKPEGVHPAQPFEAAKGTGLFIAIGAIVAALNVVLLLASLGGGEQVFSTTVKAGATGEVMSEVFQMPPAKIVGLQVSAPELNDSWVAASVALVDSKDRVIAEMDGDASFYSGYDDEGKWTEGSTESSSYFRAPPAGEYRMLIKMDGGSGETGPSRGENVTVQISRGMMLSRYFLIMFLASLAIPGLLIYRRIKFLAAKNASL